MTELAKHEAVLLDRIDDGLASIPGVTRYGDPSRRRTPTTLFNVAGRTPAEMYQRLADRGVNAPAGTFYALECADRLGLGTEGAVRAGIAPYTDESDVDRLLTAVADLAR
jgi:selenocysteine lyase/cysteine desulfurase